MISAFGIDHGEFSKGANFAPSLPLPKGSRAMKVMQAHLQNGQVAGGPKRMDIIHNNKNRTGQIRPGDPRLDSQSRIKQWRRGQRSQTRYVPGRMKDYQS